MSLLSIEALAALRGGQRLFRAVDVQVEAGARWVVSGASGTGKTSLLRALARLDPYEGRLRLRDVPAEAIPAPAWRAKVTWVSAETALAPEPVEAALRAPHRFRAAPVPFDAERARRQLDALGLSEVTLTRSTEALSAGQRQRVALARALSIEPDVLLADEPTAHLDPIARDRVVDALDRFVGRVRAAIVVSHDPAVIDGLGAQVLTLEAPP